jgi:CobQ-like glutamine amidotransferase family enzyme
VTVRILHLYPVELGINGDVGNVLALRKRAEWRGIDVEVLDHHPGEPLPADVHLVHIGSGPLSGQAAVSDDLEAITPGLLELKAAGIPFLAIAGGWQLLGMSLRTPDGEQLATAGVFSSSTVLAPRRFVGEVVLDTPLGRVAGFENHGSITTLDTGATPLGTVIRRKSAAESPTEGLVEGASVATNLHGPFLPMNPAWADRLLGDALKAAGVDSDLGESDNCTAADSIAARSRDAIAGRLSVPV